MFMLVSYSRWENTHKVYNSFSEAFADQQKLYPDFCIEEYIGSNRYLVYSPAWEQKDYSLVR